MIKLNNRSYDKYARMEDSKIAEEIRADRRFNFGIHLIDKMQGLAQPLLIETIKNTFVKQHGFTEKDFFETKKVLEAMGIIKPLPNNTHLEFTSRGNTIFNEQFPKIRN